MNDNQIRAKVANTAEVFAFLRHRYPMIHASNLFYRDLLFGLQAYLASNGIHLRGLALEGQVKLFIDAMVREGVFLPYDHQTWTLNYPEYRTPMIQKVAPATTSAGSAAGS